MKKSKIILFPTDFSEASANAFRYALRLADQINAELHVVNALFPAESGGNPELAATMVQAQNDAAQLAMKPFIENGLTQVMPMLNNAPKVFDVIEVGSAETVIEEMAEKLNADFILMGSRGENRDIVGKLIGSVTAQVVKNVQFPVLVIPEHAAFSPPTVVAYATDANSADPYEIWKAVQLLQPITPVINLVHVDLEKKGDVQAWDRMDEMKAYFKSHSPGLQIKFHYLIGADLEEELNEFMDQYNIDLLIMYQPEQTFWGRLFHRSATKNMAMKSDRPLLVQKDR